MDEIKQYESLFKGKKILFIMPELSAGGAERVMVTIIKYIDRSKYYPVLLIINEGTNPLDLNDIGCDVELINLNEKRVRNAPFKLIKAIKEINPDTVLSTLGYLNEMISLTIPFLPKSIKFIARESSIPYKRNDADSWSLIHHWIYKRTMKRFSLIVCQSEEMVGDLNQNYNFPKEQLVLIDNPLDKEYILRKAKENCPEIDKLNRNILAVGSLKKVKNYPQLIEDAIASESDVKYWILGEGSERGNLERLISELDLEHKVFLLGHQNNPWKFMVVCDEFWQKSHWEGNSNALKEWGVVKSNDFLTSAPI